MRRPAITAIILALLTVGLVEGIVVYRFLQTANRAEQWVNVESTLAQETSAIARRIMADPYAIHSHAAPERKPASRTPIVAAPATSAELSAPAAR